MHLSTTKLQGLTGLAALLAACTDAAVAPRCVPGLRIECPCPGGSNGAQTCGADGTYGACECPTPADASTDAGSDGGRTDVGVDVPIDRPALDATPDAAALDATPDAPSLDVAVPPDTGVDAGPPDATRDAGVDVPAVDVPADVPAADAPAPDSGPVGAGLLVEQRAPWRAGPCTLWEQSPPWCDYHALAADPSGLWAACDGDFVMHHAADGWTRTAVDMLPGATGLHAVASGTGWVAAVGSGPGPTVLLRRAGAWASLGGLPGALTQPVIAHGAGGDLFVGSRLGEIFRYDGASWSTLWSVAGSGTPRQLWGTRASLYEAHSLGVRRYDGATWTDLTLPASAAFVGVGGTPTEVFAASASTLYRVVGDALVVQPPPATCASLSFSGVSASAAGVAVAGSCDGAPLVWRRSGAAWVATPRVPAFALAHTALLADDGTLYVSGISAASPVYMLVAGAWVSMRERAAPPGRVITGRSATEVWVGGDGVARLGADDAWTTDPAAAGFDVRSLWEAPDGTLFVATIGAGPVWTLRRRDASGWHADYTRSALAASNFAGASSTDVHVVVGNRLLHWQGSAWTELPSPGLTDGSPGYLFRAGAHDLYSGSLWTLARYNGSGWDRISSDGYPVQASADGVPALDVVTCCSSSSTLTVQTRTDLGVSTSYLPGLPILWDVRLAASDPRTLVALVIGGPGGIGTFGRTRPAGASSVYNWLTRQGAGNSPAVWTDGRFGFAVGQFFDPSPTRADAKVMRCDFDAR